MRIVDFSKTNTVVNKFISELRDVNIQTDRMRFRRNIERIGEIMAYEISKELIRVLSISLTKQRMPLSALIVDMMPTLTSISIFRLSISLLLRSMARYSSFAILCLPPVRRCNLLTRHCWPRELRQRSSSAR